MSLWGSLRGGLARAGGLGSRPGCQALFSQALCTTTTTTTTTTATATDKGKGGQSTTAKGKERRRFAPAGSRGRGRGRDGPGGSFASRILGSRGEGGPRGPGGSRSPRPQRDGSDASSSGPGGPQRQADRTIYVKGLDYRMSEEEVRKGLTELFGQACGRVLQVRIPMDREQGRHKGYCFVKFHDPKAKQKALDEMDGADFGERWLTVDDGDSRGGASQRRRPAGAAAAAQRGGPSGSDMRMAEAAAAGAEADDGSLRSRMRRRRGRGGKWESGSQGAQQGQAPRPRGNLRSGQVKRSNRSRVREGDQGQFALSRADFKEEAKAAERERMADLDRMVEVLAAARAKREDPFFSDHERHEFEEKLVVEILTQFHPNLSVHFERDMAKLMAEASEGGEGGARVDEEEEAEEAENVFERNKEDFMELLEVSEGEWGLISENVQEDVKRAHLEVAKRYPNLIHDGSSLEEPGEDLRATPCEDPLLEDHAARALRVLKNAGGWNHASTKRYLGLMSEL